MTLRVLTLCLILSAGLTNPAVSADVFDRHTSDVLRKAAAASKPLASLSMDEAARLAALGSGVSSPCILVHTNDGNWTKAVVAWGFRKGPTAPVPVLLIERYVTYRDGRGDVTTAAGKDIMLFAGFSFNFDIGQVVPEGQGGDIRLSEQSVVEPLGDAELFALDGPQIPAETADEADPTNHDAVLPPDFSGTWKVTIDGRWRGEWSLEVDDRGRATGTFLSDESKSSYPITGRTAALPHHLKLQVQLDNAMQTIEAYLWTKDKSTLAGTATLAGRTFGFYAVRDRPDNKTPAVKEVP